MDALFGCKIAVSLEVRTYPVCRLVVEIARHAEGKVDQEGEVRLCSLPEEVVVDPFRLCLGVVTWNASQVTIFGPKVSFSL